MNMKVYMVCEVNTETREISRVREVFSDREGAINRAVVLFQDTGKYKIADEGRHLIRKTIEEYLDTFGEFYDDFDVAVFERTVDPFS